MKIGFIGLGNMAGAMIGGLVKNGLVKAEEIYGADVSDAMVEKRAKEFGIHTGKDNVAVVREADYLVLAVKPQFAADAIAGFAKELRKDQVVISIMASKCY